MKYQNYMNLFLLSTTLLVSEEIATERQHALSNLAPKGNFVLRVEGKTRSTQFSYNNKGDKVGLGEGLNAVHLNQNLFPSLAIFGEGASLGTTSSSMEFDSQRFEISFGYGITDDLTVGIIFPFGTVKNKVDFSVSGANLGKNPNYNPLVAPSATNLPYLPTTTGVTPFSTADVQALLASPTYGYKPIASTRTTGLADPTIGLLYQALKNKDSSLVLAGGVDIGIAKEDDPDNLVDVPINNGNSALRVRAEYYRNLANNWDVFAKAEYGIEFEDRVTKRVPKQGEILAPQSSTEKVKRDLGDYRSYELSLGKSVNNWRYAGRLYRLEKDADDYTSDIGTDVTVLEANTAGYANQWEAEVSWSGVDAWAKGNLAMPLIVSLAYKDTFSGKNGLDWSELYFRVTSFF
ncbi:MAG: Unknown protein [uncultured Sulfurovum sp.]|uniref:Uncharacterized protein n=1 Tax=uncultured Sulfurovum sp. TaxID=269237 RepID=A0A6S6TMQ1_9BACT|nr:MAG: Unknown protein [uncultured Sulfurovum sp.]